MSVERETRREELIATLGTALQPADRAMVDDLLDMRQLAAERLAFNENPQAVGSRRQPVAYPALAEYLALEARILATTEAVGITPRARARSGKRPDPASVDLSASSVSMRIGSFGRGVGRARTQATLPPGRTAGSCASGPWERAA